jgi:signal transduction histidine kinase
LTSMGEMAASIAHEINQPLSAIVTNANAGLRWLTNATPDLDRLETILKRVVRDGLRASDVIASVRAMFKRDANVKAPLSVEELINEVQGLVREDLQNEQILFEVRLASGLPSVLADRVQLQQVLLNLISNAIDAMRETGGRPRELRIRAQAIEPGNVLIAVADSGAGIDPKHDGRLFEAFFTTKANGMGLGLSICRSIIEAHGGRLWATRRNPHGSVFQFTLPCEGGAR